MSMNIGKNGYGGSGGVVDEDNGVVSGFEGRTWGNISMGLA